MRNDLPSGDDLGPAKIVHVREPRLGLEAVLVVDNVACGPSIGGLRMAPDVSTGECVRLARAMTLKNAAAGLPHGGGKSVLRGDPGMAADRKERLVRAFAHALRNEDDYIFGPDMGTDETCMAWVIRANTKALLDAVRAQRVSPRRAALDLAIAQVKRAMSYRRFSIL